MKITKSILAGLMLAGIAASASAQSIDLSGSTAGRSAVDAAIRALLTGETIAYSPDDSGTDKGLSKANYAIYQGTYGGNPVIIRTHWTGSAAGVRDVAQQNLINFMTTDQGTAPGTNYIATPTFETSATEIAYSDVFQSSTVYTSPTVTDDKVGVIQFKWFANAGSPTALDNMSAIAGRNLYGNGAVPLALLTGLPADEGTYVWAIGRDPESGTRITTMAEIGYGVFKQVLQNEGTIDGSTITELHAWPAGTYAEGNGGHTSGSGVANYLTKTTGAAVGYMVGYLGYSDWSTAATGLARELKHNGVTYSADNIKNGTYTFWGYLHQMKLPSLGGTASSFYTDMKTNLLANPGSGVVLTSTMRVARSTDGGNVSNSAY